MFDHVSGSRYPSMKLVKRASKNSELFTVLLSVSLLVITILVAAYHARETSVLLCEGKYRGSWCKREDSAKPWINLRDSVLARVAPNRFPSPLPNTIVRPLSLYVSQTGLKPSGCECVRRIRLPQKEVKFAAGRKRSIGKLFGVYGVLAV